MSTQPTNQPVPSESPRDLKFNAGKFDEFVTGDADFYTDRLGGKHITQRGMENKFNTQLTSQEDRFEQFLLNSGYQFIGNYEDGPLTFTARNQYTRYNGQYWRLNASTDTPFTTTGVDATSWANDVTHFVLMDSDVLRQELFQTSKYIPWTTPLAGWGSLKECFESSYETIIVPAGTYPITSTITANMVGNKRIICEPGAIFRLADNVRKNLMVFVGNGTNTFEWSGGEIDGNWEGQGPETMTGGNIDDVSHGLIMSKFGTAHVHDLYIHDCMGHHINHGGNKNFIAERITIRAHPSVLKPLGGARGDGITGYSENVTIRDITGYSTDDLIAVFSGIDWIPGWYPNKGSVKKVLIENIRCMVYTYQGVDRYSWNAVSVGNTYGYSTNQVVIKNVVGDTLNGGVMVKAEENGTDYWGAFNTIQIDGVSLCVRGDPSNGFTGKMSTPHILIGKNGPNGVSSTRNNTALQVSISNVQMRASSNTLVGIVLGHMQIREVMINNVTCTYDDALQSLHAVLVCGQRDIGNITISNVIQQDNGSATDSVKGSRSVINSYKNSPGATTLRGSNLSKLLSASGNGRYTGNTQFNSSDSFARQNMLVFGHEFIVADLDSSSSGGVLAMPIQHGVAYSTPQLGRLTYDQITGAYILHDFSTTWDATNYGLPNASTFPNFSQFRWSSDLIVPVKGSPYGERKAYVCIGGNSFAPNDGVCWSSSVAIRSSGTSPMSFSPGCVVWAYLPAQTDSGWAYQNAGMVQYLITDNSTRNGSKRIQYDSSGTSAQRVQAWNGSAWGSWQNLSV